MPTAVWTGTISFGLVAVPVKLTPATKSRDVSFNQLEAGTGSRIRYRRVSEQSGEEVPTDRIVKGYELEKGRYVIVEKDELDTLAPKASHTIDIEDFVDLADIDPIYFDTPYYVMVDEKAAKPYRLLVDAMTELGKVAIGRVVMRSKEKLVAIRPMDGMLCVETMHYADEIVDRAFAGVAGRGHRADRARVDHGPPARRDPLGQLRRRAVPRRVPRAAAGPDRQEGGRRGDRRVRDAGGTREGARPDGGARGEPPARRRWRVRRGRRVRQPVADETGEAPKRKRAPRKKSV